MVVLTSPLQSCLIGGYATAKSQHPSEGRRRWRLRVAAEFWRLPSEEKNQLPTASPANIDGNVEWVVDPDTLDEVSSSRPELGLVVRTDYSDENAWLGFVEKLQRAEEEFTASTDDEGMAEDEPGGSAGPADEDTEDNEDDDDDDDEDPSQPIFHIINPSSPEERAVLTNISNLTALRLFTDIDIRPAPAPPTGTGRVNPPNRLVDRDGWQEIYTGKYVWIYDSKSNTDQCVRLVSHTGDMYGTATGDSWRARVSHICELQVNIFTGAMKIDFGGFDRWDYNERQRNLREAEGS
ncbi:hypothetical protein BV22DRAFT_347801 [Leucogyrophana mollusca]|uniref:Uncharacterized protein n=1 Tax=Leucogyrophana mollusca TaxID=85980 RepID=A0ACB8BMN9_9AGAM|nr:hypothetical protein BV22DRAFT_347801 [Leucogyrophana mollusca]